ncbi:hypothetical protein [Clostridium tagluense]|uniref:Uncharacterized protein n=1 Tax=Clostridium tagluense TaxID=360422 RepID=A0A401UQH0_9CLOT|nr:hypothetical protein [Clostridium tagluense]GCD11779.1 hypothetical protein Ctaglu_34020 [Clostridium tagluense]
MEKMMLQGGVLSNGNLVYVVGDTRFTASGIYSANTNPSKMFDGIYTSGNHVNDALVSSLYSGLDLNIEFAMPKYVNQIRFIRNADVTTQTYTLSKYKNGVWTVVKSESAVAIGIWSEITINDNVEKIKINCVASNQGGGGAGIISELEIYTTEEKYLVKNGTDVYTVTPNFYKVAQEPVTKEMFDKYGSYDLLNMTKTLNESAILMNKVGTLGVGNEFECSLISNILSIKNVEVI